MFHFYLIILSSLSMYYSSAQVSPQNECRQRKTVLICDGKVPSSDDLDNPEIQTLVMSQLSEGSWLSLNVSQPLSNEIQQIQIQRSFISKVDAGFFASVSRKNKLKRLTFRNVDGPVVVDRNMLQGLEKSLNYLTVISGLAVNIADLTAMEHLTSLELLSTSILGTSADFKVLLPRLRSLKIRNSNISQLPWEDLANWITKDDSRRLKINDNEWICDCSMMKLKRLQPNVLESELQKLKCAEPENLRGKYLSELTEKDLCPAGEIGLKKGTGEGTLEASGSTIGDGHGRSSFGDSNMIGSKSDEIAGSSNDNLKVGTQTKASGVRTEVIIAGSIVGVLVLAFIVFLIIYKCRLFPKGKSREERTSRTHQNKRYVNVIEEPPLQQFGTNGRVKENGKFPEGAPV